MRNSTSIAFGLGWASLFSILTYAAVGPFGDKPDSPRSLPADNLPPFRMLDRDGHLPPVPSLPAGLQHGPGSKPESSAAGPSLAQSLKAAQGAVDACSAAVRC